MKYCILIFIQIFLLFFRSDAQHLSVDLPLAVPSLGAAHSWQQSVDLTAFQMKDFVAVSILMEGEYLNQDAVRCTVEDAQNEQEIPPFSEDAQEGRYVSELIYIPVEAAARLVFHFEIEQGISLSGIKGRIHIFSPTGDASAQIRPAEAPVLQNSNTCDCPQPGFVHRNAWGAAFGLTNDIYLPPAVYTTVTHLIVHHSAGTNSSSNWPGVVASIFDFHVNTNGWSDVGYNWLIDPNGILYEGRGGGENVRGAHMCGYNNNTMGVCVLGNFVNIPPPASALETLTRLLAWKCCKEGIEPGGSGPIVSYSGYMQHISGHQDGCAPNYTECPGGLLYEQLDDLRLFTSDWIQNGCSNMVGVPIPEQEATWSVSPNPVSDQIFIQFSETSYEGRISILDALGRPATDQIVVHGASDIHIPAGHWHPGMYWVVCESSTSLRTLRFIKL